MSHSFRCLAAVFLHLEGKVARLPSPSTSVGTGTVGHTHMHTHTANFSAGLRHSRTLALKGPQRPGGSEENLTLSSI